MTEKDHRLFSAMNTHFPDAADEPGRRTPRSSAWSTTSRTGSGKTASTILITFGEGDGSVKLRREVAGVMAGTGGGVVVNVLDEGSVGQSQDVVELAGESGKTKVRANVVLVDGHAAGSDAWTMLEAPAGAIEEVKDVYEEV